MTDATVLAHHNPPTLQAIPFAHGLDRPCMNPVLRLWFRLFQREQS